MLYKLCAENPSEWHKIIDPLLFAYREVPNERTGFSLFELIYGRNIQGPLQVLQQLWTGNNNEEEVKTTYDYVINLRDRLENTMKNDIDNLYKASGRYKSQYDKRTKQKKLEVGEQG